MWHGVNGWVLASCLLLRSGLTLQAAEKYALLVGINDYNSLARTTNPYTQRENGRKTWVDLEGAVNDVRWMETALVSDFDFKPEHVLVLTDATATRAEILKQFESHLIHSLKPGDQVFFYFSGHGSQVVNTKSRELDQLDETLVPADSCLGAADIRDKELSVLFNRILDRGGLLTAIIDACHSGSFHRGEKADSLVRHLPPDERDVQDSSRGTVDPALRGAVIISSAQDHQFAWESYERKNNTLHARGLFTLSLSEALEETSAEESLAKLFLRVKSRMQAKGKRQEPIVEAPLERLHAPLFGKPSPTQTMELKFPVIKKSKGDVFLIQGGQAEGLHPGCLLGRSDEKRPLLEVLEVIDLTTSRAGLLPGVAANAIIPGQLLEVKSWAYAEGRILSVWGDPTSVEEGALTATDFQSITQLLEHTPAAVAPAITAETADYRLQWRKIGEGIEFSWIHKKAVPDIQIWTLPYPRQTKWIIFETTDQLLKALERQLHHLSRLKYWLELKTPRGSNPFPYELLLRNANTRETHSEGVLSEGELYGLVLHLKEEINAIKASPRYVYVYLLTHEGNFILLFPRGSGNLENRFPLENRSDKMIPLGPEALFQIAEPYGVETLILITSDQAIVHPLGLTFRSAYTDLELKIQLPPFPQLISRGRNTRGFRRKAKPPNWSVEHLYFLTQGSGQKD